MRHGRSPLRCRAGVWLILVIAAACAQAQTPGAASGSGTAVERGRAAYEARCFACHSVDAHRIGPLHQGVVGRRAGQAPGYAYSAALRASKVVWTAASLDTWLADPERLIPGQAMGYRLEDARMRADVIAYLATLVTKP